jgi:hypothetical protein
MRRGVDDTSFYWESCIYFFFTSLLLLFLSVYIMKHNKIVGYKQNYTTRTPMQINLTKCSSLTRSNLPTYWCEATWTCEVRRRPAGRSRIYLSWLNNGGRCCFCCRIHITNIAWLSAVLDWVVGGGGGERRREARPQWISPQQWEKSHSKRYSPLLGNQPFAHITIPKAAINIWYCLHPPPLPFLLFRKETQIYKQKQRKIRYSTNEKVTPSERDYTSCTWDRALIRSLLC